MPDSILTALSEPLAKRLNRNAVGGAVVFWAIAPVAYLLRFGPPRCPPAPGAPPGNRSWCQVSQVGGLGTALVVLLCVVVVVGSSLFVGALASRLTSLIAGVGWPAAGVLSRVTYWRTGAHGRRRDRLARAPRGTPGQEFALNRRLYRYATTDVAPTRVGNTLAAMSERIADRHGLRLSVCWQALLAVLPDGTRDQLAERSTTLLHRTQVLVWSLLSAVWLAVLPLSWVAWWVAGVSAVVVVSYLGLCQAAEEYADLVEGVVVANRLLLFRAVGLPPPDSVGKEAELGQQLTRYLAGGRIDVPLSWI